VAFVFFDWLVPAKSKPGWVRDAKSKVVLKGTGDWLVSMLPEDTESYLKKLKRPKPGEDQSPDDSPPGERSDLGAPLRAH
jgi:membrane protein required for colicin V production